MQIINVFKNISTDEKIRLLLLILERVEYYEESRNIHKTIHRQER